jgi:hypothetical protein
MGLRTAWQSAKKLIKLKLHIAGWPQDYLGHYTAALDTLRLLLTSPPHRRSISLHIKCIGRHNGSHLHLHARAYVRGFFPDLKKIILIP